jgi:hypothetical protein
MSHRSKSRSLFSRTSLIRTSLLLNRSGMWGEGAN